MIYSHIPLVVGERLLTVLRLQAPNSDHNECECDLMIPSFDILSLKLISWS